MKLWNKYHVFKSMFLTYASYSVLSINNVRIIVCKAVCLLPSQSSNHRLLFRPGRHVGFGAPLPPCLVFVVCRWCVVQVWPLTHLTSFASLNIPFSMALRLDMKVPAKIAVPTDVGKVLYLQVYLWKGSPYRQTVLVNSEKQLLTLGFQASITNHSEWGRYRRKRKL